MATPVRATGRDCRSVARSRYCCTAASNSSQEEGQSPAGLNGMITSKVLATPEGTFLDELASAVRGHAD
jgi:hypothetical protein